MTTARRSVALLALLALTLILTAVVADPAGAHPLEHCFFGWTEVDGVVVEGSPDDPQHICVDEYHHHVWRDIIVGASTMAAVYPLLYALIMTPQALWQEKASRRGRWRLIVRPRRLLRALPRRYWLAYFCSFLPAYLAGYVAAPAMLDWVFPPVSTATVALYVSVCGVVTVAGWRVWVRKRRKGEPAASQQPSARDDWATSTPRKE